MGRSPAARLGQQLFCTSAQASRGRDFAANALAKSLVIGARARHGIRRAASQQPTNPFPANKLSKKTSSTSQITIKFIAAQAGLSAQNTKKHSKNDTKAHPHFAI
jgi:hypothetical protein